MWDLEREKAETAVWSKHQAMGWKTVWDCAPANHCLHLYRCLYLYYCPCLCLYLCLSPIFIFICVFSLSLSLSLLSPSGDLGIGLVWENNPTGPESFLVRLMKSSSNWTKSSMMGPQLFLGWCQMILDVFRCSQSFSDVLSCFPMFSNCFPIVFWRCFPTVKILFKLI